jgi:uncharacterized protein
MAMTDFTPWTGLAGGALIGLAAVILMAGPGRIMGASGIFAGLLTLKFGSEFRWRLTFILGLLVGAAWTGLLTFDTSSIAISASPGVLVAAGLAVGVGTVLGAGCTSGHGICGMARLSRRSLAATLTFMATAMVTVFIMRHMLGP